MSIRSLVANNFCFMSLMFLDGGHEFIWFDKALFFFDRMVHEDISVGFYFRKEDFVS
jgi:hypothetical protein